jgi:hypothetical protein
MSRLILVLATSEAGGRPPGAASIDWSWRPAAERRWPCRATLNSICGAATRNAGGA